MWIWYLFLYLGLSCAITWTCLHTQTLALGLVFYVELKLLPFKTHKQMNEDTNKFT